MSSSSPTTVLISETFMRVRPAHSSAQHEISTRKSAALSAMRPLLKSRDPSKGTQRRRSQSRRAPLKAASDDAEEMRNDGDQEKDVAG